MNIYENAKGLSATEKLYWKDSRLFVAEAKVLKAFNEGSNFYIVLDKTIFYPQGGDQVTDTGIIKSSNGEMQVKKALLSKGVILHFGKINGEIKEGDDVDLQIHEQSRIKHMLTHSLGHLIGSCIWQIKPEIKITDSLMTNPGWLKFEGNLTENDLKKVEQLTHQAIKEDRKTTIRFVSLEELKKICKHVPDKLPPTNLRIVQIDGFEPIPCGGTHVKSLSEIKNFKVIGIQQMGIDKAVVFDLVS